jgi:DNA-binding CsgD family transcriptional regulator
MAAQGNTLKGRKRRAGQPKMSDATIVLRRRKALDLKAKGASYVQIGEALGVSNKTAYYDVQHAAAELDAETKILATRYIDIELQTLDLAQRNLVPVVQGTEKGIKASDRAAAANAIVRIGERRAKLLGLDAPDRHELSGRDGGPIVTETTTTMTDEELLRRVEAMRAAIGGPAAPLTLTVAPIAPTPEQEAAEKYAEVLAKRNGGSNGNGNGNHG